MSPARAVVALREMLALWWLRRAFHGRRADYYEYLAALLVQGDGRKTLRDIFDDDAHRYGRGSVRGRLAALWAQRYRDHGGDLGRTFDGSLPADDVALVRAAQLAGAGALGAALADVAATVRLLERAQAAVLATLFAAALAVLVCAATLAAVPLYTVPTLHATFQVVPEAYWGERTRGLFGLADALRASLPLLAGGLALVAGLAAWSLPGLTGRLRRRLDGVFIWRIYRDFHGIRFLALLGTMLRRRGNVATPLRDALLAQMPGATAWKAWHLNRMLERLDDGVVGADTFATGMIERETAWFLADMVAIHGLDLGLARTRERIETSLLGRVVRRAVALRWVLLGGAVAALLGIVFWHYAVIDELRRAMQTYYAGF